MWLKTPGINLGCHWTQGPKQLVSLHHLAQPCSMLERSHWAWCQKSCLRSRAQVNPVELNGESLSPLCLIGSNCVRWSSLNKSLWSGDWDALIAIAETPAHPSAKESVLTTAQGLRTRRESSPKGKTCCQRRLNGSLAVKALYVHFQGVVC